MQQENSRPVLEQALSQDRQMAIRIDLGKSVTALDADELTLLRSVLTRHGVICLTGQQLQPIELRDFVQRWGEVLILPAGLAFNNQEPGLPEIARVGNVRPDGTVIPNSTLAEYWHHDGDFWQNGDNYILNFLYSAMVPKSGGNTGFLDTRKAYADLSSERKAVLEGSYVVVHSSDIDDFKHTKEEERPKDAIHPTCFPHPITQEQALYLPESHTGIQKGDTVVAQSKTLIQEIEQTQGIYEHRWSVGDLLIWDNLQVMHRSMGGYFDDARLLYRCQARIRG